MNMNITEIEKLNETDVKAIASEMMVIKGFNIYFVDIEGAFGYSCLVFKNNHSIHYVNDYELHHNHIVKESGKEALKEYYIQRLNNKLFTEEEIKEPLKSYNDYTAKDYFLRNYYHMQEDYVSMFRIIRNEEEQKAFDEEVKDLYRNPISFCYMANKEFIEHEKELMDALNQRKAEVATNFEYQKSAFLYEMYNHEYGINWQADYDTLSAFGNLHFANNDENELENYFNQLGFNNIQRKAYLAARNEYCKKEAC